MREQSRTSMQQLTTSTQERKERVIHPCQCKSRDSDKVKRLTMTVKISLQACAGETHQKEKKLSPIQESLRGKQGKQYSLLPHID